MFGVQSEAVVNAGPAVFISQTGPNPIMVQVLFSHLTGKLTVFRVRDYILFC